MVFCLPQNNLLMKLVNLDNDVVSRSPFQTLDKFAGKIQAACTHTCAAKFSILYVRHVGSQEKVPYQERTHKGNTDQNNILQRGS